MLRTLITAAAATLTTIGVVVAVQDVAAPSSVPSAGRTGAAAAQTLTWTADNSTTKYKSAPTTATAGAATIVFENSTATGNDTNMTHTLTFDTSTPGYNHDVNLNITANPSDSNGGKYQADVTLTPGKYRYFCALPGHSQMAGELIVTDGGGEDTTPPTVTAEVTGDQDQNGAYIGKATVGLTAADDNSGVKSTEYNLDGGAWTPYTAPVVVDAVGAHMVHYRATDNAGNVSEEGMAEFTVVAGDPGDDTTPPTVAAEVTGEQDANGAYVGKATVTVTSADDGSGVKSTEYNVDGGAWTPYTAPLVVDAVGAHMVHYRATDNAGNVSEEGMAEFTVVAGDPQDTTPPTVAAEVTGEQDADGNFVGTATVTITATDEGSGVAGVEYEVDDTGFHPYTEPVAVTEPGDHAVQYRATDAAGNVSETGSVPFRVVEGAPEDTTAPKASAALAGTQDAAGNYLDGATVTLAAEDEDGGSGLARIDYALDGGGYTQYTEPLAVTAKGEHRVTYRAMDNAGNVSREALVHFTVVLKSDPDTVAPAVSLMLTGNQDANWNYIGSATATLTAEDPHSGVGKIEYALDDGAWTAYADPVVIDDAGAHAIRYRATDAAGNTSDERSGTFNVVEEGKDGCPDSNTRKTVTIAGKNTGVSNVDTGNGCTVSDLIDETAAFPNHATFVKHVGKVTKALVLGGTLTTEERNKIVSSLPR